MVFHCFIVIFKRKISQTLSEALFLKGTVAFFSRLYIAWQSLETDLEQFFEHENQPEPPSIPVKEEFDLVQNLTSVSGVACVDITARIIDGAAVANMRKPKVARTFGEYAGM